MRRLIALGLVLTTALACTPSHSRRDQILAAIATLEDQRDGGSAELAAWTTHVDSEVRLRAVAALGRIQHGDDAAVLEAALHDADERVARAAVFALGQLGLAMGARPPASATTAVSSWLDQEDPERVALAAEALGKLAPLDASERLVPLLAHPDALIRAELAHALFRLRFAPRWRGEITSEPDLTEAGRATLIALLDDSDPAPRRAAAHAFARLPEPRAGIALLDGVHDPDEWIRLFSIRALGRLGAEAPPAAAPAIAVVATDPSPRVRREVLVALGLLRSIELAPIEVARDPSAHVRAALASALATDWSPDTLRLLHQLEETDRSRVVRLAALTALAQRLGPDSEVLLRARSGSDDPWVRAEVAHALGGLPLPLRLDLGPSLLVDRALRVRIAALEAYGSDDFATAALEAALQSDDVAERGAVVGVLAAATSASHSEQLRSAFAGAPGESWIELREAVVDALAEDADFLIEAARDPASAVRARAGAALRRLGIEPPLVETASPPPSRFLETPPPTRPVVRFETERGAFEIEGLGDIAPLHVASLLALVDSGFYDGLTFHRVVAGFVVQGGDPRGDGWGGPDFQLRDEVSRVRFDRGMVGMAKAGKDTGGSQLFIALVPTPHLDGNYTVYARVVAGMEVVDALEPGDQIVTARRVR